MPPYTASLLSVHAAYTAWLWQQRLPWTGATAALGASLQAQAYRYALRYPQTITEAQRAWRP